MQTVANIFAWMPHLHPSGHALFSVFVTLIFVYYMFGFIFIIVFFADKTIRHTWRSCFIIAGLYLCIPIWALLIVGLIGYWATK